MPAPESIHQLVKRFEEKMVSLVERMLELHKQSPRLYRLTEEEIRILEGL